MTKSDDGDQKPFGSAFWHSGARATWNAKKADTSLGTNDVAIGLYHRKSNLGPLQPAVGFRFMFDSDGRVAVTPVDVAHVDDLAAKLPLWQRLRAALRAGPQSVEALADNLAEKTDSVRKALIRSPKIFTRVEGAGQKAHFALVERRAG